MSAALAALRARVGSLDDCYCRHPKRAADDDVDSGFERRRAPGPAVLGIPVQAACSQSHATGPFPRRVQQEMHLAGYLSEMLRRSTG